MDATFAEARRDQATRLSNAVLRRTVIGAVAFGVAYVALAVVFNRIFNVKPYLTYWSFWEMVRMAIALLEPVGFVVGLVLIMRSGIKRAIGYFDELLGAVLEMMEGKEGPVRLPAELAQTEIALNRVQEERDRSDRAAKAAEERKNDLVAYLAHDVKTPLTSVIGYLSLLEESPDLPTETRARYTGITLEKAYRLEALLDEFFEITRYNLSSIPLERTRFDAALFCRQVIDEFYPVAQARSLSLAYEGPEELPVLADAGRMARVANNILKNAVAYADEGTAVTVRTACADGADGTRWWELTVTDTGRELSPHHLEHVFERFYRVDGARGTDAGGAGLGLAIAREIARAHGGEIYAASQNGTTSFTVWIPQG